MAKSPHTPGWRAMVALEYIEGAGSSYDLADKYGVNPKTVQRWAQQYKEQGIMAFSKGMGNARYTSDFKLMCIELYISGQMSADQIVAKYSISGNYVLRQWIKRYNANKELRDYDPKREVYMADARRKTTLDERKKIVEYCLNHNWDYKHTAAAFDVSYNQVYSWLKKYSINGEAGLADKRGRHKQDNEVDELERLRRENLRLKRQLEEKDMVVELLKKVKEFEGM